MLAFETRPMAAWKAPGGLQRGLLGLPLSSKSDQKPIRFFGQLSSLFWGSFGTSTPRRRPDPPPLRSRVLDHFWLRIDKIPCVFAFFAERRFWHPVYLSFSLVFFPSVTDAETRPDLKAAPCRRPSIQRIPPQGLSIPPWFWASRAFPSFFEG